VSGGPPSSPGPPSRLPALGPRGEGWVVLQSVVGGAALVAGLAGPPWPSGVLWATRLAGLAFGVGGAALGVAGGRHLEGSISPYPAPRDDAALREHGAYALVRHPIYGGLILLSTAWSLFTSPAALGPTALLALVFEGKRRREEGLLRARYPGYVGYAARVRRRFVPFVW